MVMATWLADVLGTARLTVVEEKGWQGRGRGPMSEIRGVLCHHTGGPPGSNAGSLSTVSQGRADLAGPLSHLHLARDGTFTVIAAGRCNHAGAGRWQGVMAGNSSFIGIEAENAGTGRDLWPKVQIEAYATGAAAILNHIRADSVMCAGHKEFALPRGRKIDPSFDMVEFRELVAAKQRLMKGEAVRIPSVATVDPARAMLRKGDQGASVGLLQQRLGITIDLAFGPKTEAAVRAFQRAHSLVADGMVGPKTWAALGVTGTSSPVGD